jgi:hypothetical protein
MPQNFVALVDVRICIGKRNAAKGNKKAASSKI